MAIRRRPMISATVSPDTIRRFEEIRRINGMMASRAIDEGIKLYQQGLRRKR